MKPVTIVARAAHLNQNKTAGAITFVIAGFCSSDILGIFGIWTKFKYHSSPIHIIPDTTWRYLNNQLKKYLSNTNPSPLKYKPANKRIAIIKDKCTVFDNDCSIEIIIPYITKFYL